MASDIDSAGVVSSELLALLRCPETMQRLSLAPPEMLERIARAGLCDRRGVPAAPLAAALLRADSAVVYPLREGIPILLADHAVDLP